ncbi:MAG: hypothetical protein ACYS9X_17245, partial [Planctomycetota bacterium]
MKQHLRNRRDRASERHDAALARYPTREGSAFEGELRSAVDELATVAQLADDPSSDPVEVAKSYRWLGDACFDLGRGKDMPTLTRGKHAYQRAEELLVDAEAPVEKAKLNFNYGNTLRGLSEGSDISLLEAAQTRYESAAKAFRANHLPDFAATVAEQLRTIDPQLRLARKQVELQRGYDRMEELKEKAETAGPKGNEAIREELADLRRNAGRGDTGDALREVLDGIHDQIEEHPERVGDAGDKLGSLQRGMQNLASMLQNASPGEAQIPPPGDPAKEIVRMLSERLQRELEQGCVSGDRGRQLDDLLGRFTSAMSSDGDDVDAIAKRAHDMRTVIKQMKDAVMSPSWPTPAPEPGSRAHRVVSILAPLRHHLLAEKVRSMLPSEESTAGTGLLMRLAKLEACVRKAAKDESRVANLEEEAWSLALEVQEHARRYHLIVCQPRSVTVKSHAKSKSLFLSGGRELFSAADELAARDALELLGKEYRGDRAQERWNQLCSASVAVFDAGVPDGAALADVCYELGLAFACGKPMVVAARPRQKLPFDVNLRPIRLSGDRERDTGMLSEAIGKTLGSVVWGGHEAGFGDGPGDALEWLGRRFPRRLSEGTLPVAVQLAEGHRDDAVAFRRSLEQLLGMLGADAPEVLLPAWPPAYPDPGGKPRCFHIMPFRPKWAKPTRDIAAEVCDAKGWVYSRGDEADEQRIIRGIWQEIGRSSAVLVDVTGHTPNVALELGLVHALG